MNIKTLTLLACISFSVTASAQSITSVYTQKDWMEGKVLSQKKVVKMAKKQPVEMKAWAEKTFATPSAYPDPAAITVFITNFVNGSMAKNKFYNTTPEIPLLAKTRLLNHIKLELFAPSVSGCTVKADEVDLPIDEPNHSYTQTIARPIQESDCEANMAGTIEVAITGAGVEVYWKNYSNKRHMVLMDQGKKMAYRDL